MNDDRDRKNRGGGGGRTVLSNNRVPGAAPSFLTTEVSPPLRPQLYVDRPRLNERIDRAGQPIVAVQAPAGFGKTALLSDVHRRARGRGLLAAWLTLDEFDTEDTFERHLLHAFEQAGLDLGVGKGPADSWLELLVRKIEYHVNPCLLVVDALERLAGRGRDALDFLIHYAPGNLRVVFGLREDPGIDLSSAVLGGWATVIRANQLRFTREEVSEFFNDDLSRRELASVMAWTEGWAIALCLCRECWFKDKAAATAPGSLHNWPVDEEVVANWMNARLLGDLTSADREFLLDLAQFDEVDTTMVDRVLKRKDTARRIAALAPLEGLLSYSAAMPRRRRMHPLLKVHGSAMRKVENPERYRELHRVIALAEVQQGHVERAVRHAEMAEDIELLGKILNQAGGLKLSLREGPKSLSRIERFLTQEVIDRFPRLALLKCRLLVNRASLLEARNLYDRTRVRTEQFTRDPEGNGSALYREAMVLKGILLGYGCRPVDDAVIDELAASLESANAEDDSEPVIRAAHSTLLFAAHIQSARFRQAVARGIEAEAQYALSDSKRGSIHLNVLYGCMAVARGKPEVAESRFSRAVQIVTQSKPVDNDMLQAASVLLVELDLERNRLAAVERLIPSIPVPLRNSVAWTEVYAAAYETVADWRFEKSGLEEALVTVEEARDAADAAHLVSVVRLLTGLKISYLIIAGFMDEAERSWYDTGLPKESAGILELDRQSWREMEAIGCARIRWLTATGRLAAARTFALRMAEFARENSLMRTLVRCLTLLVVLESRDGDRDEALSHLGELLRMVSWSQYTRALVRERKIISVLLRELLEIQEEPAVRETAERLLEQLGGAREARPTQFSQRERAILDYLREGLRDKEIAVRLSLTTDGVRYHLKNVYRKLGASSRLDAVRRAREDWVIS